MELEIVPQGDILTFQDFEVGNSIRQFIQFFFSLILYKNEYYFSPYTTLFPKNKPKGMVSRVALSPYRRAEYNLNVDFITKKNFVWIGFISKNGIPVTFQIMDRENNLVIYSVKRKVEFMAKLNIKKVENIKFILINDDAAQVKTLKNS